MQPTMDVMKDLMVIYLSGEASPDTRALVEDFARQNAAYAALLEKAAGQLTAPVAAPAADTEIRALKKTRQFVFLRSLFFGMGIAFTLIPFTFVFRDGTVTFLLYRDAPGLGISLWSVAAASWSACYVMYRSVRKTGL